MRTQHTDSLLSEQTGCLFTSPWIPHAEATVYLWSRENLTSKIIAMDATITKALLDGMSLSLLSFNYSC